jgi:dienelactone hydrolase
MIQTEKISYDGPGGPFYGSVSWDDKTAGARPGVLIAPTFKGLSEFEINKAVELAKLGYTGFAIDLYGNGKSTDNPEEATAMMSELNNNRPLLSQRMNAAFQAMIALAQVDEARTAAIGFCFGGKCVLDLGRSGAELKGIVTFHGIYDPPPQNDNPFKAAVLLLHGWEDPLAPPEQLINIARELTAKQVDWQVCGYGHTGHSFTNPKANFPERGMFYQPSADKRAWQAMCYFFNELFSL